MDFDSTLPHAFSNTLMILVCIFVLLWFLKSMRRAYHAVCLRYHLLYDQVIEIAGLGSYLTYFDDASRAHLHAIVHTRQTKPPVHMSVAYVPLSLQHIHLAADRQQRELEVKFLATTPGRLFLIPDLKVKKLKHALHSQLKSVLLGGSGAASAHSQPAHDHSLGNKWAVSHKQKQVVNFVRRTVFNMPESSVVVGKDGQESSQELPWLSSNELCHAAKAAFVHCHSGLQVVRFTVEELINKQKRNDANMEFLDVALVFVPTCAAQDMVISSVSTTYQPTASESHPRDTSASAAIRDDDSVASSVATSPEQRAGNETLLRPASGNNSILSSVPFVNSVFSVFAPASAGRSLSNVNENTPLSSPVADTNNPSANYRFSPNSSSSSPEKELANMGANMEITIADFFMLQLPVNNADAAATGSSKKDIYPKELFIMDLTGRVYNSMEVFGLNAVNDQANKAAERSSNATSPSPAQAAFNPSAAAVRSSPNNSKRIAPVEDEQAYQAGKDGSALEPTEIKIGINRVNPHDDSTSNITTTSPGLMISQGGKFPRDECVVCLTEAKEIMLLPCRHLCVCSSCLTYVDKCPVCRAFFEEYVQIQSKQNVHFRV